MSSSESILLNNPNESILDADEIDDEVVVVTRGKGKIYQPFCDFEDFERVQQSIKNGIKPTGLGFKHWYECKHKFAGCQTTMYVLVENGSTGRIFVSDNEHTNHHEQEKVDTIPQHVLDKITEFEALFLKPEAILQNLIKLGIDPPKKSKLNNLLRKIRSEKQISTLMRQPNKTRQRTGSKSIENVDDENQTASRSFSVNASANAKKRKLDNAGGKLWAKKQDQYCSDFYDLNKNFYQYLLHLDQLKEFFHNLVTLTDHMGQD
ncbi:hypothetical protein BpHYR1_008884 [Brachionus plicatilis]|uniref:Uncharacterized protein n=1 Tax=Brachionus plicatilis TaxID=10195 RepID=A0A3M7R7V0_BRAPC|nr:hypothetical protein BpHYR1_008884 [Brachionus plicatilis]